MSDMEFGELMRNKREGQLMTLRGLGKATGLDFTYISKIETGAVPPPSPDAVIRIADVLGWPRDEALNLADKTISANRHYALIAEKDQHIAALQARVAELEGIIKEMRCLNHLESGKRCKGIPYCETCYAKVQADLFDEAEARDDD